MRVVAPLFVDAAPPGGVLLLWLLGFVGRYFETEKRGHYVRYFGYGAGELWGGVYGMVSVGWSAGTIRGGW